MIKASYGPKPDTPLNKLVTKKDLEPSESFREKQSDLNVLNIGQNVIQEGVSELLELKKPVIKPLTKRFKIGKHSFHHDIYPESTRNTQESSQRSTSYNML